MWRTVDNRSDRTPVEDFIVGCTRDKYDKELIAPEDERDYPTLFIIPSQLERRLSIQKKEIEFENYEDYEDHLTELKIKEEQKKKEESKKEIKLKHIDEIVIHDEE